MLAGGDNPQWKVAGDMNEIRLGHGAAVVRTADANPHQLFVCGGTANGRPHVTCELYDIVRDQWVFQEARLDRSMLCKAVSLFGGSCVLAVEVGNRLSTCCVALDLRSSSTAWRTTTSPQHQSSGSAIAAVSDEEVLMLGGTDPVATRMVQQLDVRADAWRVREELRLPSPASSHCAVVLP